MSVDNSPKQALQHSLTQLANSFQASETTITAEQIAECLDHLPTTHLTALNRLFSLIYHSQHNQDHGHQSPTCSSATRPPSARLHSSGGSIPPSTTPASVGSSRGSVTSQVDLTRPSRTPNAATRPAYYDRRRSKKDDNKSSKSKDHREELSMVPATTTPRRSTPGPSPHLIGFSQDRSSQDRPVLSEGNPCPPPMQLGSPRLGQANDMRTDTGITCISFPAKIESLLHTCISDPSALLRAVTDSKVSLPTGQGWRAAIATKSNNADLRDVTRIFHRFECYNIYQHVVAAGYHTGVHWVRDMRTLLAEKLRQDFPARFSDQKAASKCLQWVDQGCRYREWVEKLSGSVLNLGYLIALPCNVPHSTYTSRCTKEQIVSTVIELKDMGIDQLVDTMKLNHIADHIVRSLHNMTIGTHEEPAPTQQGHTGQSQSVSSSVASSEALTPPELTMLDVSQCTFDAFEDPWLEDWIGRETDGPVIRAPVEIDGDTALQTFKSPRTDLSSPVMANGIICSPSTATDPFNEWYQQ